MWRKDELPIATRPEKKTRAEVCLDVEGIAFVEPLCTLLLCRVVLLIAISIVYIMY